MKDAKTRCLSHRQMVVVTLAAALSTHRVIVQTNERSGKATLDTVCANATLPASAMPKCHGC
jgi:hypothetical protein